MNYTGEKCPNCRLLIKQPNTVDTIKITICKCSEEEKLQAELFVIKDLASKICNPIVRYDDDFSMMKSEVIKDSRNIAFEISKKIEALAMKDR